MSVREFMGPAYAPNRFTIDQVRDFWDGVADEYEHEGTELAAAHFQRFERAFAHFQPRDGMRALNIWSRTGEAIDYFRRRAPHLCLVNAEVSPRMLARARARYPHETFIHTDLHALPFEDAEFDFILSLETLEHTPDPLALLREFARVLKPGGKLVLSCPPATAELPLRLYERFCRNHGEGPHRFPSSREVKTLLRAAGLHLEQHESTLFIPVGPRLLRRLEPVVERVAARTPLRELGIRQFYVCRRPTAVPPWQELLRDVVQPDLCTRCGTCVGVCPTGVLAFTDLDGACLPAAVNPTACTQCGWCTRACPGAHVSFADVHRAAADAPTHSVALGPLRRLRIAQAQDAAIHQAGASGGVVTALLCDLLARGEITGAVVLDAHPAAPWRPWPRIARTRAEILHAAQSKYCVTPTNAILQDVAPARERLAVVALPCQLHALGALERHGHPVARAVALTIGLYCGNQLHFGATRSFLRRHGVQNLADVAEIRYRDGAWPGQVRCYLKGGDTVAAPKFEFNHLISFYVVQRCLLCTDLAAEGADLAVADAWGGETSGGAGASLVVTRTARGEALVADCTARGVLSGTEIPLARALAMHAHGLDLKKTGAFLRLAARARRGQPVPQYDTPAPQVTWQRQLAEVFIAAHFRWLATRPARWLVDRVPFPVLGRVYSWARTLWKGAAARRYTPAPSPAPSRPARLSWWRILGPLLLLLMLGRVGPAKCWAALQAADPAWFLAASVLSVPALAFKVLRWQELVRAFGFRISFAASAGMYASGSLAGAVTPGKLGDLAKVPLLAAHGVPWSTGVAASLLDRVFDAALVFLFGLLGVLALPAFPGRSVIAFAAVVAIGVTGAAVVVFRATCAHALRATRLRWWLDMGVTTLASLAPYFASVYCCAQALELPLGWLDILAGASVAAVLALLPVTVAGIGTRDAAFIVVFGARGVSPEHALALSTLLLAWMLVNGALFLVTSRLGSGARASATRSTTS
jgi:coenzyme F420 hydrogenase subunit beta